MKRMKNISGIIMLAGMVWMFAGCKKFLTEAPLSQVPTEDYFKAVKDITAAVAGMYASFQQEMIGDGVTNSDLGGKYHYWGEARSDNFDRGQYANSIINELSLNALTSGNATTSWAGLYRTIGRANYCLKYIPQVPKYDLNATATVVNNNMAQCYAMRAMCYFYIVRLWGDAPMWTEPYLDVTQQAEKPRVPKTQVLDTVLNDLQKAYTLIQKNQTPVVWTIGEAAICAMLADVYMWKKDYPNTIVWVKKLFAAKAPSAKVYTGTTGAGGDLEAMTDWKANLFMNPVASKEAIWSIYWDNTNNGCACIPVSIQKSNNPIRVDSIIWNDWKNAFGRTDKRVILTIDTLPNTGHVDKIFKYYTVNATNSAIATTVEASAVYLVMYRLADIYLLYAEALNKNGDLPNALKYLNFVHQRAGIAAYLATDPAVADMSSMENTILLERQYELFGEGKRWFDLVRTNKVNTIMDPVLNLRQKRLGSAPTGFGSDQNKILSPLNRNILEDNKLLKQNDSYN